MSDTMTCKWCKRRIEYINGRWIDRESPMGPPLDICGVGGQRHEPAPVAQTTQGKPYSHPMDDSFECQDSPAASPAASEPPVDVERDEEAWLEKRADQEYKYFISVGGLVSDIVAEQQPELPPIQRWQWIESDEGDFWMSRSATGKWVKYSAHTRQLSCALSQVRALQAEAECQKESMLSEIAAANALGHQWMNKSFALDDQLAILRESHKALLEVAKEIVRIDDEGDSPRWDFWSPKLRAAISRADKIGGQS